MKIRTLVFTSFAVFVSIPFITGCNKNANPAPPVHDTTVIVNTDTVEVPPPPDPTVNLTKGLLLYLPFSGNIADSSGNNNQTAAINGASLTYDAHGYADNAFGGNGSNQAILVTNNGSIKFDTAFTASLDFMTTDLTTQHVFLSMINFNDGYGASFVFGTTDISTSSNVPNTTKLSYAVLDSTGGCGSYADTTRKATALANFVPDLGAWYNGVLIYHRGTVQLFINGSLISTTTSTGTIANLCSASNLVVGGWWSSGIFGVAGKLDNVRLYNRVLTPHEIAALASNYQVTSTRIQPLPVTH